MHDRLQRGGLVTAARLPGPVVELGLARVSKQMRWRKLRQMWIGVKHPTDQLRTPQLRHLGNPERVERGRIGLFFNDVDRPAERLLENPERSPPSSRITITQVRGQALHRSRHKQL